MIGQIRSGHHAVIKIGDGGKKGDHTDSKQDLTSLLISAFYHLPTLQPHGRKNQQCCCRKDHKISCPQKIRLHDPQIPGGQLFPSGIIDCHRQFFCGLIKPEIIGSMPQCTVQMLAVAQQASLIHSAVFHSADRDGIPGAFVGQLHPVYSCPQRNMLKYRLFCIRFPFRKSIASGIVPFPVGHGNTDDTTHHQCSQNPQNHISDIRFFLHLSHSPLVTCCKSFEIKRKNP